MAKRTHTSSCNQSRKNHKNGIKKPKWIRWLDLPGINQKTMKNILKSRYYLKSGGNKE